MESPATTALNGSVATRVTHPTSPIAFSARGQDWRQRVWFDQVGTASYVAGGTVERD